jgi:hypothetical protein
MTLPGEETTRRVARRAGISRAATLPREKATRRVAWRAGISRGTTLPREEATRRVARRAGISRGTTLPREEATRRRARQAGISRGTTSPREEATRRRARQAGISHGTTLPREETIGTSRGMTLPGKIATLWEQVAAVCTTLRMRAAHLSRRSRCRRGPGEPPHRPRCPALRLRQRYDDVSVIKSKRLARSQRSPWDTGTHPRELPLKCAKARISSVLGADAPSRVSVSQ